MIMYTVPEAEKCESEFSKDKGELWGFFCEQFRGKFNMS